MGDRLTLLGTGTCQLQAHRAASAVLIERESVRVVFDFGRGVAQRLTGLGLGQDGIEHVVLSHFHADHWSDLIPFLQASSWSRLDPRSRDLHIWGPEGLGGWLERLLGLFGPGELVREDRFRVHGHEVSGGHFDIGALSFESVHLPPAGNHGLRFAASRGQVALTGDSHYHDRAVDFVRDADIAVVDAGHPSENEIVELAVRGNMRRLVCSHLYRELDANALAERARVAGFAGSLIVGRDLMTFDV